MMAFQHGVYGSEVPTSVLSPVEASAGLPVVFGTAPINLANTQEYVNKPVLVYNYSEAEKALGYSDDWDNYTLCEFMYSHFQLFNMSPVVLVNVLDPAKHKMNVMDEPLSLVNKVGIINRTGVLLDTLQVKETVGGAPLEKGTDYMTAFDDDGHVVITSLGSYTSFVVTYDYLDPSQVSNSEIIGGVDANGKATGLELINQVFPMFRLVPGQILVPGWSHDPVVAAVIKAKCSNINGVFKAISLVDLDSSDDGAAIYTDAPAWKNENNYTDPLQVAFWPKVKLGDKVFHLSTQAAGVICQTDANNDDIPYVSPSNKNLQANGVITESGAEVSLGIDQANYLNSQGIVTALNFTGGYKLWGNQTASYPAITDVKDSFIAVRRMFNWINNTLILTYFQNVDDPTNRSLIESVVDSVSIWLNGLAARGALLGGRVAFLSEENPVSDLLAGIVRFHLYMASPVPAQALHFTLEYDVSYLSALFAA
jgi:uncharacterized protein